MNRLSLFVLLLLSGLGLQAQTTLSTITIATDPPGANFTVDGQVFNQAVTFVWPVGSTHIVAFMTDHVQPGQTPTVCQTSSQGDTQWCLQQWADNLGILQPKNDPVQTVTADPTVTSLTAKVNLFYRVMLNFFAGPGSNIPPTCGAPGAIPAGVFRPGVVFVSNQCFWASTNIFVQSGDTVALNAFPYPGFAFVGWTSNLAPTNAYLTNMTVNGPVILVPHFSPAKRVTFLTSPLQLEVVVDHVDIPTRRIANLCEHPEPVNPLTGFPPLCVGDFDFAPLSQHFIGGLSPQRDAIGQWWIFDHFSDGISQNGIYTTDTNVSQSQTITATFVRGAQVGFFTTPPGMKLTVDGRQNWPSYDFVWGMNTSHQVAAAANQFDAKGRQYVFQSWSNAGAASQSFTIDQNAINTGVRMTAAYNILSRVVVQSTPPGLSVQVDGATCQTPCNVDRTNGSQVHVTAPSSISMGTGSRLDFTGWSDGGASDHIVTVSQDYASVNANYKASYQLNAASDPANGVTFKFSPTSSDMFYGQNTQVTVTAQPATGFKFRRWGGALSGTYPSGALTMAAPMSVIAHMDKIPFIAPAGVQNAAGQTPGSSVASGSVIAIFGQSLSPSLEVGPVNPLSQSVAGISVTIDKEVMLPLLFVSSGQINAQVPSEMPAGKHTIQIQSLGEPEVDGTLTIVRNAPGLFTQTLQSQEYAVAFHSDGTLVTPTSPAKGGETIALLGTGFGPYKGVVIDGFFPPDPPPALMDAVIVSFGNQFPSTTWAGAAPGYTGLVLVKFQVPKGSPSGGAPASVSVNGVKSNTVTVPVQ